jgi:hypothetical protein
MAAIEAGFDSTKKIEEIGKELPIKRNTFDQLKSRNKEFEAAGIIEIKEKIGKWKIYKVNWKAILLLFWGYLKKQLFAWNTQIVDIKNQLALRKNKVKKEDWVYWNVAFRTCNEKIEKLEVLFGRALEKIEYKRFYELLVSSLSAYMIKCLYLHPEMSFKKFCESYVLIAEQGIPYGSKHRLSGKELNKQSDIISEVFGIYSDIGKTKQVLEVI